MLIEDLVAVEGMPVGTAMLMYTGVGAAAVVVPLVLIGLVLLIMTRFKKRGENYCDAKHSFTQILCYSTHSISSLSLIFAGNPLMSDAPGWGDRENPAFEFWCFRSVFAANHCEYCSLMLAIIRWKLHFKCDFNFHSENLTQLMHDTHDTSLSAALASCPDCILLKCQ